MKGLERALVVDDGSLSREVGTTSGGQARLILLLLYCSPRMSGEGSCSLVFPELYNWGLFTLRVPGTKTVFVRVDMMTFQGGQKPFRETLHPDLPMGQALLPRGGQGGRRGLTGCWGHSNVQQGLWGSSTSKSPGLFPLLQWKQLPPPQPQSQPPPNPAAPPLLRGPLPQRRRQRLGGRMPSRVAMPPWSSWCGKAPSEGSPP